MRREVAAVVRRPAPDDHPGAGDCEAIRPGWLAQPANAASCLSFVAAGAWLWRRLGRRGSTSPEAALFCGLVAANGIGGIAFHGPGDRASHWLHDTALVGTFAAMAASRAPVGAAATALAGTALAVRPTATNVASVVGVAAVAGAETRARRRPRARTGLVLLTAAAVNAVSRTGGPCCRPRSLLQGHALWHVLNAVALADWGLAAYAPAEDR